VRGALMSSSGGGRFDGSPPFAARINMKRLIIAVMLLSSTTRATSAQELPVEDRVCITNAVARLPPAAALNIEGSRVVERRVIEHSQGRRSQNPFPTYRMKLEIDVSVGGHSSTYTFNCIQSGQSTLIQPLGMR
jgi:hypothetical protein